MPESNNNVKVTKFDTLKGAVEKCASAIDGWKAPSLKDAKIVAKRLFNRINVFDDKTAIKNSLVEKNFFTSLNMVCEFHSGLCEGLSGRAAKIIQRAKDLNSCLSKCKNEAGKNWKAKNIVKNRDDMFMANYNLFKSVNKFAQQLKNEYGLTNETIDNKDDPEIKNAKISLQFLDTLSKILAFESNRFKQKLEVKDTQFTYDAAGFNGYYFLNNDFFSKLAPSLDHIKQGMFRDCYLLSAVQGLCATSSGREAIKNLFSGEFTVNKDGTFSGNVKITFFKVKLITERNEEKSTLTMKTKANGMVTIKVDPAFIGRGNQVTDVDAHWVKLLEKAFMIYMDGSNVTDVDDNYRKLTNTPLKGTYYPNTQHATLASPTYSVTNIEGGYSTIPMTAITGKSGISTLIYYKKCDDSSSGCSASYNVVTQVDKLTSFEIFKKALVNDKVVTAITKSKNVIENLNTQSIINIFNKPSGYFLSSTIVVDQHVYTVIQVKDDDSIVLLNPHRTVEADINKDTSGTINVTFGGHNVGEVHMNLAAFKQYFGTYHISKTKSKTP